MFGIGTLTTIILFGLMGPTISLCIIAVAFAYVSSVVVTMFRAELSDTMLTQDMAHIKRAFDTDAIVSATPTRKDTAAKSNKILTRITRTLLGPHTRLQARPPVYASVPLQVMRIASIVGGVHAANMQPFVSKTRVLEITIDSYHCTYTLANIMPPAEFEFHVLDTTTSITQSTSKNYPNVIIHGNHNIDQWPAFDLIFTVESVNLINSMHDFMGKASKYLTAHGRLVIIDGFRSENFASATPNQQLATRLAERAFGVKELHPMSAWIECAHSRGLTLYRLEDWTTQAMPFWTMGWRVSHSIIAHAPAWLLRRLHATPYTAPVTNSLLAFATAAHALRNRTAVVYGVVEFAKMVVNN